MSNERVAMTTTSQCAFQITGWEESTYQEIAGGAKLTRAKVAQTYSGAIEGSSSIDYLMAYSADGSAAFVGLERVTGSVDGHSGTMVLQHVGTFAQGAARSAWTIVAGAGTDGLTGLRGSGSYVAGHGAPAEVSFTYTVETHA